MSYLTVTNNCRCANYKVPLRAIREVLIPKSQDDFSFSEDSSKPEYVITVNYLQNEQYKLKFCEKCWKDVEDVITQMKQVVRHTLFKETA